MHECTPVFSLSFHTGYACRHSGACCTAGWPISVEPELARTLGRAALRQTLGARHGAPLFNDATAHDDNPAEPRVLTVVDGACICYDATGGGARGRCRVHRHLGPGALPLACRQVPRVSVLDPRGVFVTLSHYCPTAADMLARPACPAAIVDSAAGFARGGEYEGLDARNSLPPLLRPDMLMDWDSWSLFERLSVEMLVESADSATSALIQLATAVEHARGWSPGLGPLASHLSDAFAHAATAAAVAAPGEPGRDLANVVSAIPRDLYARFVEPRLATRTARPVADIVMRRFLAAHAFANWAAHLGLGLRTWWRSIAAAHALVSMGLGVDGADLLLRHLGDPAALALTWSAAEAGSSLPS
jgi:hypothetical protein